VKIVAGGLHSNIRIRRAINKTICEMSIDRFVPMDMGLIYLPIKNRTLSKNNSISS
jgi:hypothetical protein